MAYTTFCIELSPPSDCSQNLFMHGFAMDMGSYS